MQFLIGVSVSFLYRMCAGHSVGGQNKCWLGLRVSVCSSFRCDLTNLQSTAVEGGGVGCGWVVWRKENERYDRNRKMVALLDEWLSARKTTRSAFAILT